MYIYLAGTPGTKLREREWQTKIKLRLLSFWNINQDTFNVPYAFELIKESKNENISGRKLCIKNENGFME
jgi:hypothetical protein